jgi:hypothetical protein
MNLKVLEQTFLIIATQERIFPDIDVQYQAEMDGGA